MASVRTLTEADLFRAYWDEGLLDLLAGLALLIAGLGWTSELGPLAVLQAPLWIVLWGPLRRRIVEPRAGYVRFSVERRARNTRRLRATLVLGVAALVLTALAAFLLLGRGAGPDAARWVAGLPAVLVALAAFIACFLTGAGRFVWYGVAMTACAAATVLLAQSPALPLVVVGAAVVVAGALLLARFVRDSRAYADPS